MNVAIFASAFHPAMGGVEELCRQLALDYRKNGMDAIIITNRWPRNALPEYELFQGIPVYRLAIRVPEGDLKMRLTFRLTIGAEMARLHSILKKHKSELLHIQCVTTSAYHALRAHDTLNLPLFVTTQGERTMDAGKTFEKSPLMNDLLRELYDKAAFISACSRDTLDDAEQFYGKPFGDRAKVIYNGVALKDFEGAAPYPYPKPYLLGIGRSVPQKGFDILLRAYAQSGIASHDLLLAGDGPERPALEQLARDLKLDEEVKFLGRAERPVAVSLFKGCSFFVLPSRLEPQGIVNLEAMACGKAVVASKVGGVPEIVLDGETGLLFPGEDVPALAAALIRMADDEPLRARMGAAGRVRAEAFDWSALAEQYRAVYRKILARP